MRKALSFLNLIFTTIFLSMVALVVSPFDSKGEAIHRIARLWASIHLRISGIKVFLEGLENITNPPYIFMCNHQSALDIFALLSALPLSFKWIAKRELFFIPFFGWTMKRAGYISLDRKNPREALKAIDEAARKIKEGMNIIIFPEGTRSKDGSLLPFKKGGFSLALRARVPIVPVGIWGTSRLQPKGSFIPKEKGIIYIRIGEPMHIEEESRSAKTKIMLEVRRHIERLMAYKEIK
jgi:1-acyl-sn-glycerol-3-phosphate acyltransferase